MNLIFIGFRGTGKSSVGKIVAKQLSREFVDVDVYIERNANKSIKEIFDEGGEKSFRELEILAIKELCKSDNTVIATGGGSVLNNINVVNMKQNGFVVLLESDPEIIYARLNQDTDRYAQRPGLTEKEPRDEINHLLSVRRELYHKSADLVLDTSLDTIEEVSKKVVNSFYISD
ncbi:MAG: shikimate kinase [Candidatus Anammoxibacter sp.]